ncbi:MAG TPA: Rieske 2Fe-2S domain-containing protein [Candidatus Limnocylindrales bacterium]|nr:Rieske 2Fe-2S domain-containing protein [Candidatus Limnocylindrales bacterium]
MAKVKDELTPEQVAELQSRRLEEQSQERARRMQQKTVMPSLWSRRDFFGRMGWMGFGLVSTVALLAAVRSAFPRVLFTPDTTFKAGTLDEYPIGEVSEKFKKDYRVWIVREAEGIYALFAKCTHLGCTPRWLKADNKFKCPCHGSGFYPTGINFEGPAPRPLERVRITQAEDGQLVVDVGVKYRYEKGDWERPGAYLRA